MCWGVCGRGRNRRSARASRRDPQAQQFVKFARECHIVGAGVTEADPPLTEADVNVIYTAEVKRKKGPGGVQKMDFGDFLTALMKLSVKVRIRCAPRPCVSFPPPFPPASSVALPNSSACDNDSCALPLRSPLAAPCDAGVPEQCAQVRR